MLQVYIIHDGARPITLVLLTIALAMFGYKAPKVNAWLFCIYQLLFFNSVFDTFKGLHINALVVML